MDFCGCKSFTIIHDGNPLCFRKKRKLRKQQESFAHQLRKRGYLGGKAPSPEKKRAVSEDQEGCGQTSQQTSPDWFEGEENAQENVWSEQAYELP